MGAVGFAIFLLVQPFLTFFVHFNLSILENLPLIGWLKLYSIGVFKFDLWIWRSCLKCMRLARKLKSRMEMHTSARTRVPSSTNAVMANCTVPSGANSRRVDLQVKRFQRASGAKLLAQAKSINPIWMGCLGPIWELGKQSDKFRIPTRGARRADETPAI